MSVNALVTGPVETESAAAGLGVVESVYDLSQALSSGSWLAVGLTGVGAALDVAAAVVDPFGSLIAAGLGWLMEHLQPLKGWLNDLTGDSAAVAGFAATWDNIASAMGAAGDELTRVVRADLDGMAGASVVAYATYANGLAERLRATKASAGSVAGALRTCAMVVQAVHDVVRDTLAQLVGSIISWAAEALLTLGLATPAIVGQVSTRVSSLATRIGKSVTDVITSAKALKNLVGALKDALVDLARSARRGAAGAADEVTDVVVRQADNAAQNAGVAFFGPSNLKYYLRADPTLGTASSPFFHMPLQDGLIVRNADDALRYTGNAPSVLDEVVRAGKDGTDPEIFGLAFPTDGLSSRVPTPADAGGWPHYLEGGHTAVRIDDAPGMPGTGGYLVNPTRERVVPGGPPVPDGSVLFTIAPDGSWVPLKVFP